MLAKQPLARRIVIAFTLMTLVVSGAFALGIVGVVHFIEEQLVTEELSRDLDIVLNEDLPKGRTPQLDTSTHFFASHMPEHPMPKFAVELDHIARIGLAEATLHAEQRLSANETGKDESKQATEQQCQQ